MFRRFDAADQFGSPTPSATQYRERFGQLASAARSPAGRAVTGLALRTAASAASGALLYSTLQAVADVANEAGWSNWQKRAAYGAVRNVFSEGRRYVSRTGYRSQRRQRTFKMPYRYGRKRRRSTFGRRRRRTRRRFTRRKSRSQKRITPRYNRSLFLSSRPQRISQMTPRRVQVMFKNQSGWFDRGTETHGSGVAALYGSSGAANSWIPIDAPAATNTAEDHGRFFIMNNLGSAGFYHVVGLQMPAGRQPQFFDQYMKKYKYLRCYQAFHTVEIIIRGVATPVSIVQQQFGYVSELDTARPTGAVASATVYGVPPMSGKQLGAVRNSPYCRSRTVPMMRGSNTSLQRATLKFNMTNPAKWFDESRKQLVTEGDKPYSVDNITGNRWVADCSNRAVGATLPAVTSTVPVPPSNQVIGSWQMYKNVAETTRGASQTLTEYKYRLTSNYKVEFFDPEEGQEYVIDQQAVPA